MTSRIVTAVCALLLAASQAVATVPPAATPGKAPAASSAAATPAERLFQVTLRYNYHAVPKQVQRFDFWFPLAFDDAFQMRQNLFTMAPYDLEFQTDPVTGNVIYHMVGGPRGGVPLQVSFRMDMRRAAQRVDLTRPPAAPTTPAQDLAARERWLRPEKHCPLSKEAKTRASKATKRGKPQDRARGIFDYVVSNMTLLADASKTPGAGQGDLDFALREMKGTAEDLASAFVGLCRALDIPARTVMGMLIPEGVRNGQISGYHGWAEFYLDGYGWIPVDPALAVRHPSRRDEYFGGLDANRVAISIGRDVTLIPVQSTGPLNYFINPHWEGDGLEMPSPWVEAEFTELESIPRMLSQPVDADASAPTTPAPGKPPTP
ncbi:MAG: transglutaminase-like domain-containing protein [Candidatus Polarisedimenticolia bacterium]